MAPILALTLFSLSGPSFAAFDAQAVLSDIEKISGIDLDAQRQCLLAGELVTSADGRYEVEKGEIAAAQLTYLPVKVADIAALLSNGRFHSRAKQVQALESADAAVSIVSLDDKGARRLTKASPGDDFNFSAAEFEQLESGGDDVAGTLNAILSARHAAYRQSELSGITEYQRSKKESVNITDFLEETAKTSEMMPKHFPELYAAALEYPEGGASLDHKLFAVALEVEGEPQFVLSHWAIDKDSGDYVGLLQRVLRQPHVRHASDEPSVPAVRRPLACGAAESDLHPEGCRLRRRDGPQHRPQATGQGHRGNVRPRQNRSAMTVAFPRLTDAAQSTGRSDYVSVLWPA
jgi:hypothetical protein